MNTGDRVLIRDTEHPWYGQAGELGEPFPNSRDMYVVHLDNGMRAGAYLRQLERL